MRINKKVVLSAKVVEAKVRERKSKVLFDSLSEGQVFQGEVTRLANFGAFVDLGGSDGFNTYFRTFMEEN